MLININFSMFSLNKFFTKIIILFFCILFLNQCNLYRKTDAREIPTNAKDRANKNMAEGRRIKFGDLNKGGGSGKFEFASSNEMWRASIEIIDFMPLSNVDYGGGIIITDWYSQSSEDDPLKIMIQFLSNDVRADGLKVTVYKKVCDENNSNCSTTFDESDIGSELKLAILRKASVYKNENIAKEAEEFEDNRPLLPKDMGN